MKRKIYILLLMIIMPLFISGEELLGNSSGEVEEKSQFVADLEVKENKHVNGIFVAGGDEVTIDGYSEYGVFTGNNLIINSTIEKDLFIGGNIVKLNTNVLRDSYVAGKIINISGFYEKDFYLLGDTITLENITINGNLKVKCSTLKIKDNVKINSINYNDTCNIIDIDKATINSINTYDSPKAENESKSVLNSITSLIGDIISLVLVAFLINCIFPNIYKKINKKIKGKELLKKSLEGFLILIGVPIAALIIMCTVIALPISIIILIIYGLLCYLAKLTILSIIGNFIYTKLFKKKKDNPYLSILIGIIVYEILLLIPCIGTIISILSLLIGFGYVKEMFCNLRK